jgi:tRNA modification GTPase
MDYVNRQDTIVALSTGAGIAAIAVIRLSGQSAIQIAGRIFKQKNQKAISEANSHTVHFGEIYDGEALIDEVLVTIMIAPHTYTGEDTIEISCHGSPFIQQQIIRLCQKNGARLAGPGEFTFRAFINGKLDLSQAEAVAELIASDSSVSHQLALKQMRGGFSNEIKKLRQELIHFASLIELELDFAEEDVEFANRTDLQKLISKLQQVIHRLIESFELGNVLKNGIPVVIAGKPNVGKSTLLNALLNEERAIVSEIAGTTRDTIEEEIILGGIKFRFIDTAGIRETQDVIEKTGVMKTFEKMEQSPLVLYMFDVNETGAGDLKHELGELKTNLKNEIRIIPLANKIDGKNLKDLHKEFAGEENVFFISAKEKTNVHQLATILPELVNKGNINNASTIVTNTRHAEALQKTSEALTRAYDGLTVGRSNDFLAADIRQALYHLGEITGQISTEDLLENIFSRFCIGK